MAELAVELPPGAIGQLLSYLELLSKWTRTYNLTAIREPHEMVSHHLLDCLAVVPHLPIPAKATLADIGAGAGLPGIALAVARPQWQVTLNDSSQKKCAFMRQASMELGLRNVQVHEGRVQQWAPRTRFALVISRAFADLERFIALCSHLVAADGVLAAMTGARPQRAGCTVVELRVPGLAAQRHLALCRPAG